MINQSISKGSEEYAGYYELPRHSLLNLLGSWQPTRALEIGCGAGANLAELKRRYPQCGSVGIEIRQDAAEIARAVVDKVIVGNVLDRDGIDIEQTFDLVVLSHVLEHFAQPELVLARVREWLAPGGYLLVALPNIQHLSVLVQLVLHGDFPYQPSGILDHTHLRFFTRRSAERFFQGNGLRIVSSAADVNGVKSELLDRMTGGLLRDFAAFAHNFLVEFE